MGWDLPRFRPGLFYFFDFSKKTLDETVNLWKIGLSARKADKKRAAALKRTGEKSMINVNSRKLENAEWVSWKKIRWALRTGFGS
jgi:hypothetical protein